MRKGWRTETAMLVCDIEMQSANSSFFWSSRFVLGSTNTNQAPTNVDA